MDTLRESPSPQRTTWSRAKAHHPPIVPISRYTCSIERPRKEYIRLHLHPCRSMYEKRKKKKNTQAKRPKLLRMWYKPQIDSFHMFRNPSGHRSQGAERAVDLARNVAGTRVRTGQRGSRTPPEQDQHHGEGWPMRLRGHLVPGRGSWTPVGEPHKETRLWPGSS